MIFDRAWLTDVFDGKACVQFMAKTIPEVRVPQRGVILEAFQAVRQRFEDDLYAGRPIHRDVKHLGELAMLAVELIEGEKSRTHRLAESFANVRATDVNAAVPAG